MLIIHKLRSKQDKDLVQDLQQQVDQSRKQYGLENELDQQVYMALKTSFTELEKRCVKHQKTEIEVKRQLTSYQSFVVSFQLRFYKIKILFFLFRMIYNVKLKN